MRVCMSKSDAINQPYIILDFLHINTSLNSQASGCCTVVK